MKTLITLSISLILGLSTELQGSEFYSINSLKWLAGCWASVGGETGSGEQWTLPAGGTLFGVSRTVHDGKTVAHEFIQIRTTEAGEIELIARPSGQAGGSFPMQSLSADEVVFENPTHDFPQRIIYHLKSPGYIEAKIEGQVEGVARTVDFPLQRIDCESPRPDS